MSLSSLPETLEDPTVITTISIGLFVGALIGAMALVTPFPVVLIMGALCGVTVIKQRQASMFELILLLGLTFGSGIGTLGAQIPFGVTIFFATLTAMTFWKISTGGAAVLNSMIGVIAFVLISVGLFYNSAYPDFCIRNGLDVCNDPANWVNGYPTVWNGCVQTCTLNLQVFFGSSPLGLFILAATSGDFVGFIQSLFSSTQSAIFTGSGFLNIITTILSLVIGTCLLFIGLGLGFTAGALTATFGITINEAGTRAAQSFGIGLILWGLVFGTFGGWLTVLGNPLSVNFGGILQGSILVLFATVWCYGYYIQGKTTIG